MQRFFSVLAGIALILLGLLALAGNLLVRATGTGLLLGLSLPAGLPLWMAFLGGAFGIGFGKMVWGGLGQNAFNPALVGRTVLLISFPAEMNVNSSGMQAEEGLI